jgi:hypothetical protein
MLKLPAEVVYLVGDLAEPVDVIHVPSVNDGLQLRVSGMSNQTTSSVGPESQDR